MINYSNLVQEFNSTLAVSTSRSLFYGAAGSGKTRLASTFPKPFFIDADRGMRSIDKTGKIQFLRIPGVTVSAQGVVIGPNTFDLVMSVLKDAKDSTGPFAAGQPLADRETIVIDSISALVDEFLLKEIMLSNKRNPLTDKAIFDDYGQLKIQLVQIGMLIKDVSDRRNVIVTALVDEEKDALTGAIEGKPLMTGKYRDIIGGVFDEEYYLESSDAGAGNQKYMLYAAKYKWFEAKTRLLDKNRLDVTDSGYDLIKATYRTNGSTPAVTASKPVVVAATPSSAPTSAVPSYGPK